MVGSEDDLDLIAGVNNETIILTRAAAKINIQLKKAVAEDIPVTISRISLLKNTTKTTLWKDAEVTFTQGYWNYNGPVSLTLSKDDWSAAHTVYVYENLGNSSTSKTNATQLEIEGTFNGLPATYRVYVNEDVTSDEDSTPGDPDSSVTTPKDHFYNIKRNHVYNITGTMGQFDGITIYTDVEEWVPVEKDYFVGYGYTVEVDGTKVTVSNHDEDCPPHVITLKTLGSFTFSDNSTEQTFEETAAGVTKQFTLNQEPQADDDYLEVYYNGVLVNTFTK